ncbi:MAG: hemin receptor [Rhodanobacteraceae bacterium]|jgi:nitric oxide dioxygenase|nr:hemin receptor [Rhodanobacteraceae bacterium]
MHDDDIRQLRDSFAAIRQAREDFGRRFYATLFRLRPDARRLFPADTDMQARKLADMLATIVRDLDDPARLEREFAALGRRHAEYGVSEDDYDDVGAALLMTLRESLGAAFTPALEQAWATLYGDLAEAMIAAEHRASEA